MEYLNFHTFWLGLLSGMILSVVTFMVLYNARVFGFEHCAISANTCTASEYYTNPGSAIALGHTASSILSVNSYGEMLYKRVPVEGSECTPGANQTVYIQNPQYCLFSDGVDTSEGKALEFGSTEYKLEDGTTITSSANCTPSTMSGYTSGSVEIKWDPVF